MGQKIHKNDPSWRSHIIMWISGAQSKKSTIQKDSVITSRDIVIMENTESTVKIMLNSNTSTSKDTEERKIQLGKQAI